MVDLLNTALNEAFAMPILSLNLHTDLRHFRTAREIAKDGHGNYICGEIEINPPPKHGETMRLELSLVPASDASQSQHMIHPNLLSINIKEQNRIKFRSDMTSAKVWKMILLLRNGEVFYQDPINGSTCKVDNLFDGNKILLGNSFDASLGQEHILINIVTPLLRKEGTGALLIEDIVKERWSNDKSCSRNVPGLSVKNITKEYTSGESKREIHRCRLRACLFQDGTDFVKVSEVFSETIKDTKDKNFGNFQVACLSEPHGACAHGGLKCFLVAKARVGASGFYPVFVFANSDLDMKPERVEKVFPAFKPIAHGKDDLEIYHNSTFRFRIPAQRKEVIQAIKLYRLKTYITLYREADDQYASNMVRFDYHDIHDSMEDNDETCSYCEIKKNMPHTEVRRENMAKIKRKKRYDTDSTSGISDVGSPASTVQMDEETSHFVNPNFQLEDIANVDDILQTIETSPAPHFIDLGLGEFDSSLFDQPMRDGPAEGTESSSPEESDTSSDSDESETEIESSGSDDDKVDDLCKYTKSLNV